MSLDIDWSTELYISFLIETVGFPRRKDSVPRS